MVSCRPSDGSSGRRGRRVCCTRGGRALGPRSCGLGRHSSQLPGICRVLGVHVSQDVVVEWVLLRVLALCKKALVSEYPFCLELRYTHVF